MSDQKIAEKTRAAAIREKLAKILTPVTADQDMRQILADVLREQGFGMRRQVETTPWPAEDPTRLALAKKGIVLDTETTGFDSKENGITQLSMIEFFYDDEGIFRIGGMFDRYNDPGEPISEEITKITGITDEMVAGRKIEDSELAEFIEGAERIIAHHAAFDREFVEEKFPDAGFDKIVWDCSIEQIDWAARGFNSQKLEIIAANMGYVYDAHRADSDILATLRVLDKPGPDGMRSAFSEMIENSALDYVHIIATGSPFSGKDILKDAGYKWDGEGTKTRGKGKAWHIFTTATQENLDAQAEVLRAAYGREISLEVFVMDGKTRYSDRPATRREVLRTAEPSTLIDTLRMSTLADADANPTLV